MGYAFHGINKDVLGGPEGSNQTALQMLMQSIIEGQKKRQNNQQLSSLFSGAGNAAEQQAQQINPNVALDMSPAHGGGPNGLPSPPPQQNAGQFVDWVLGNPTLSAEVKNRALDAVKLKSSLNYQDALAENARAPKPGKEEDKRIVEYWKPDGSPGGKVLVPDSKYNDMVSKLEEKGFIVQEPKGTDKPTSEFERLLDKLEKSGKVKPGQKNAIIESRLKKLIDAGEDAANKITLGDGMTVTLAELRAQYREKYNIPDEFELQMMAINPDPMVRQQATRMKAEAATKPSFVEFMQDAHKKGLEGVRPEKKQTSPADNLPPGFKLEK